MIKTQNTQKPINKKQWITKNENNKNKTKQKRNKKQTKQ